MKAGGYYDECRGVTGDSYRRKPVIQSPLSGRGRIMRILIGAMAVMLLAGCSTSGLEQGAPAFSSQSKKSPQQFARCLAPKWQAFNSSTSSIETESGYKIAASAAYSGVVALAVVDQVSTGSSVRVFLPMDWAGTSGWKDAARACI